MADQPRGYGAPILEDYSVTREPAPEASDVEGARTRGGEPASRLRVTLRGRNFMERAMMPMIRIGKVWVREYQISPDGATIICYLDEVPEEGAAISISYGQGQGTVLSESFSLSKLTE